MRQKIEIIKGVKSSDLARYYLARAADDGDLITPLKMQKLVYLAFAETLARHNKKLFDQDFQAWPNGPVEPDLYQELKKYGSMPINPDYAKGYEVFLEKIPSEVKKTLDEVYEEYISKSAFELVNITHSQKPWLKAREGLDAAERTNNKIGVEDILEEFQS